MWLKSLIESAVGKNREPYAGSMTTAEYDDFTVMNELLVGAYPILTQKDEDYNFILDHFWDANRNPRFDWPGCNEYMQQHYPELFGAQAWD